MCKVTRISLKYEKTVFEEPYRSQVFGATVEFELGEDDDKNEVFEKGSKYLVDAVNWEVNKYAPNAQSHEELTKPKKGKRSDYL